MPIPDLRPGVTILHGNNLQAMRETIAAWTDTLGDATQVELNLARLDGKNVNENDLRTAANAMPFLAARRLVLIQRFLPSERYKSESTRARFLSIFEHLPETTSLILTVEDHGQARRGQMQWEVLGAGHWLRKWAQEHAEIAVLHTFQLPTENEMPGWIIQYAKAQKGQVLPPAAVELFRYIGTDTQIAAQEINKLLTYTNFTRPVEVEDVRLLVADIHEVDIFTVTDALGRRDSTTALQLLMRLLEERDGLEVLGIITAHFRKLLAVREALDEGRGARELPALLSREPFRISGDWYAGKLAEQAHRFSLARLVAIYHGLAEVDEQLKSSADPRTAFAAWVVQQVSV